MSVKLRKREKPSRPTMSSSDRIAFAVDNLGETHLSSYLLGTEAAATALDDATREGN